MNDARWLVLAAILLALLVIPFGWDTAPAAIDGTELAPTLVSIAVTAPCNKVSSPLTRTGDKMGTVDAYGDCQGVHRTHCPSD